MRSPSSSTELARVRFAAPFPAVRDRRPLGASLALVGLALAGVAAATGPFGGRPAVLGAAGLLVAVGVAVRLRPPPLLGLHHARAEAAIAALNAGDAAAAGDLLAAIWWSDGPVTVPLLDPAAVLARLAPPARAALLDAEAALVEAGLTLPLFAAA